MPFYCLNEVFFNTFSHLCFILLEDVSIDVRGNSGITMPKVLGNSLNIKVITKQKALRNAELFDKINPKWVIISWRTEVRDVRPSDRTSYAPSYGSRGSGSRPS